MCNDAGKHTILRVKKRPGKETEDVLMAEGETLDFPSDDEDEEDMFDYGLLDEDEEPRGKRVSTNAA